MTPYAIWSPPWNHAVGGIRALFGLRDALAARGCDATIVHDGQDTDPDAIAVYPEIVTANPFGAARIVRWRLAPAVVPADGLTVDWTDFGAGHPLLTVDLVDPVLFARRTGPRSGALWWEHKGRADPALVPIGAPRITADWPPTRELVADTLAGAQVLVSFDEFSTLNVEAILLGTPVLLHPTAGVRTADQLRGEEWTRHGVAFDSVDLPAAASATAGAWDWYRAEQSHMSATVDRFVERTQGTWPTCG